MTDRIIKVLENNRLVTRGANVCGRRAMVTMDEDETLPFTVDWSGWLGSDTISSVTNESQGPALTNESNTTTTASMSISASNDGYIEHRVTTAAGAIKELRIIVNADGDTRRYPTG